MHAAEHPKVFQKDELSPMHPLVHSIYAEEPDSTGCINVAKNIAAIATAAIF